MQAKELDKLFTRDLRHLLLVTKKKEFRTFIIKIRDSCTKSVPTTERDIQLRVIEPSRFEGAVIHKVLFLVKKQLVKVHFKLVIIAKKEGGYLGIGIRKIAIPKDKQFINDL